MNQESIDPLAPIGRQTARIVCNPLSSVPCTVCAFSQVWRFPVSVSGSLELVSGILALLLLGPGSQPIYLQLGAHDLMWAQNHFEGHSISSQPPGQQSRESWFPKPPQIRKTEPGEMRNPTSARIDFCNTSNAKCLAFQSQTSRFRSNNQKKQPGNKHEKIHSF